ncbi:tetratricopeptide repeat protein [Vibrio hyugaensis]|uniref:HEAT repeat domain-containing protein n=1 Tax=Vibrio hyugaensis TaxID=1534743 RepID=UPI003DA133A1
MTFSKTLLALALGVTVSQSVMAQDETLLVPDQVSSTSITSAQEANSTQMTPQQVVAKLSYQAQDVKQPTEKRIEALRNLANYPSQNALVAVARSLQDKDPAIREAAIVAAEPYTIEHRWRMIEPLLSDSEAMVRITAATNLVRDFSNVSSEQQETLEGPVSELVKYLETKKDDASKLLLADVYRWHHQFDSADKIYQSLVTKTPENPQVWLSLADNYRAQERDADAVKTLETAIELHPDNASLHYSKALTLVRLDEKQNAAQEIEKAADMAKNNSYFWYLNGVLQEDFNLDKSVKSFEQAYLISGAPEQLYAVCDIYVRYNNPKTDECLGELEKVAPSYVIDQLKEKKGQKNAKVNS